MNMKDNNLSYPLLRVFIIALNTYMQSNSDPDVQNPVYSYMLSDILNEFSFFDRSRENYYKFMQPLLIQDLMETYSIDNFNYDVIQIINETVHLHKFFPFQYDTRPLYDSYMYYLISYFNGTDISPYDRPRIFFPHYCCFQCPRQHKSFPTDCRNVPWPNS